MAVITLIEDDEDFATIVYKLFELFDHEIYYASRGLEGLRLVQQHKSNIVLLDLDLPDLDGKSIINRIRNIPELKETVILVITADARETTKRVVLQMGATEVLHKPVDIQYLVDTINRHIAQVDGLLD